ncbi:hypothetical protein [Aquipuribacter sp. SD81]|uniref:hypothetical protein n=1 Tax=Aquipuribacter sp. SD81 TaxID=3127703 RepID=UPI00301905B0
MLALGTVVGAVVFTSLSRSASGSDIYLHLGLVAQQRDGEIRLGYTLYYDLLDLLSGRGDEDAVRRAAVTVLAVSYGARLAVTWTLLSLLAVGTRARVAATLVAGVAAPLTLTPLAYFHLGKLSPVLWHNSTAVLAVPFALLLFASTCRLMTSRAPSWALQAGQVGLVVASAWTKPNYVLALVPALGLVGLGAALSAPRGERAKRTYDLLRRVAPTGLAAAAVLLLQYVGTYSGPGLVIQGETVRNTVAPFAVWEVWQTRFGVRILPSLFLSVVPVALLTYLVWRTRRYRYPLVLAWTSVLVGLVQFTVLAEVLDDGSVLFHGNWVWGAQLSMAVLFTLCVGMFARDFVTLGRRRWVAVSLLAFQTAMGLVFLALIPFVRL